MMHYAYGEQSRQSKDTPDRVVMELALDLHLTPDQVRSINIRDLNKLKMVRAARILGQMQKSQEF